ncbi:MAG: hypothetical protein JXE07_03355 [Candidatus Aminicenantes bacterium]|nr:hypothetical protein [Candidatus Aminicenantes bacterium]
MATMKAVGIPRELFWDTPVDRLDLQDNQRFIIERTLELGDEKTVEWLFSTYARTDIERVLRESKNLSPKSSRYWSLMLGK